MKLHFDLEYTDTHKAVNAFQNPKVLDEIYGKNNHCFENWNQDNKRKGMVHGIEIPLLLRPFAGGATATAKIHEKMKRNDDGKIWIHAKVKPAIVGAEFVTCNTYLTIAPPQNPGDKVTLDIEVKSRIFLPPPFRGISRDFVNMTSAMSLTKMVEVINRPEHRPKNAGN